MKGSKTESEDEWKRNNENGEGFQKLSFRLLLTDKGSHRDCM
jgi:hypothetical protein